MPAELHTTLTPDTPVRYLKGVGPKTAERFEKLAIGTPSHLGASGQKGRVSG